ncbi:HPP family protein [Nocardia sp. NPDC051750]|uniref:HPP family protein n=1 Tax=Nocardia sp. NPDC051750 TaxID=3364325 RepID=UPI0037954393
MRVRDVMSRPVVSVRRETPVSEAVSLLTTHGFAALPVVDDRERVIGIVSEADAMGALESRKGSSVVEVAMSTPVEVVEPTTEVSEVVKAALDHHRRSLPVVAAGVLVGMVSRSDLLRAFALNEGVIEARVYSLLDDYAGSHRGWDVEVADSTVTVRGACADEAERRVVTAMIRTIPGAGDVRVVDTARAGAGE